MVLPIIMAWFFAQQDGSVSKWKFAFQYWFLFPQNTVLVTGHKMGTDPSRATLQNVKFPSILNSHPNFYESQTITFLAVNTTIFPANFDPFLDNSRWSLFTMNKNVANDLSRHEHDTTNLMAHYVTSIHLPWGPIKILFDLVG